MTTTQKNALFPLWIMIILIGMLSITNPLNSQAMAQENTTSFQANNTATSPADNSTTMSPANITTTSGAMSKNDVINTLLSYGPAFHGIGMGLAMDTTYEDQASRFYTAFDKIQTVKNVFDEATGGASSVATVSTNNITTQPDNNSTTSSPSNITTTSGAMSKGDVIGNLERSAEPLYDMAQMLKEAQAEDYQDYRVIYPQFYDIFDNLQNVKTTFDYATDGSFKSKTQVILDTLSDAQYDAGEAKKHIQNYDPDGALNYIHNAINKLTNVTNTSLPPAKLSMDEVINIFQNLGGSRDQYTGEFRGGDLVTIAQNLESGQTLQDQVSQFYTAFEKLQAVQNTLEKSGYSDPFQN